MNTHRTMRLHILCLSTIKICGLVNETHNYTKHTFCTSVVFVNLLTYLIRNKFCLLFFSVFVFVRFFFCCFNFNRRTLRTEILKVVYQILHKSKCGIIFCIHLCLGADCAGFWNGFEWLWVDIFFFWKVFEVFLIQKLSNIKNKVTLIN